MILECHVGQDEFKKQLSRVGFKKWPCRFERSTPIYVIAAISIHLFQPKLFVHRSDCHLSNLSVMNRFFCVVLINLVSASPFINVSELSVNGKVHYGK